MMRHLTFIGLSLVLFQAAYAQRHSLSLKITYRQDYCGGARPNEEILAEAAKEKAFANQKMILLRGKKADTLYTDAEGRLNLRLKKGEYFLFEPWRYYQQGMNGLERSYFNSVCLEQEWRKAKLRISIKGKTVKVEEMNAIHYHCDWQLPCLAEGKQPPIPE